ncbi:transglutaminase family protein [Devosia submarina]|uniref:transglutaminase family protein n=1 Tax=Devosia submarina TaxID=1173082 RepID=UPI001FEC1213|nr:transglutaminase family protein [Devosia submarina]
MRISIRHQLSISPPPGTANLVLQTLLTSRNGPAQRIESWTLDLPGMENAAPFEDAFGNSAFLVNQARPEGPLLVEVNGVVETQDTHGVLGKLAGDPVPALFRRMTRLTRAPVTLYGKFRGSKDSRIDVLHALMLRVSETLDPAAAGTGAQAQMQGEDGQSQSQGGQSQGEQNATGVTEQALSLASEDDAGVVEAEGHEVAARLPRPPATDYAHLFVGAARALGIPARYVTGYLVGEGDEPGAFHAWAEAYDDKLGWIGFDAMLELCPTDRHVRLAAGLDSLSAAPLRCVPAGDGVQDLGVQIDILD